MYYKIVEIYIIIGRTVEGIYLFMSATLAPPYLKITQKIIPTTFISLEQL